MLFSLFLFYFPIEIAKEQNPIIFIIDEKVDGNFLEAPKEKITPDNSHGEKVITAIGTFTGAKIIPLSVENNLGEIDKNKYLRSLNYIKNYSEKNEDKNILINISLGFSEKNFQKNLIKRLDKENILIVAAVGNDNSEKNLYPASFGNVLAVAATENNTKMKASNYGKYVDISAPGVINLKENIYLPGFNFRKEYILKGTSFAAPRVTSLLAKILSYNKNIDITRAVDIVKSTASNIEDDLYKEGKMGVGKIAKERALIKASKYYLLSKSLLILSILISSLVLLIILWEKYSISSLLIFFLGIILYLILQPFFIKIIKLLGIIKLSFIIIMTLAMIYLGKYLLRFYSIRAVNLINSGNTEYKNLILKRLNNSFFIKQAILHLKILARLKSPEILILIKKINYYNIEAETIAQEIKNTQRSKRKKFELNGELLYYLFNLNYRQQKISAEILKSLANPIILIPLKNIIKNRNNYRNNKNAIYLSLEIVESFKLKAKDFSNLLKNIVEEESDEWLRYYALKAYIEVAKDEDDYQKFLEDIKKDIIEPVNLALK